MLRFTEYLLEGNPLAQHEKKIKQGHHFVGISAEREGLSAEENNKRTAALKADLKAGGYVYRKARGMWDGGGENSLTVYSKAPGEEAGNQLKTDMVALGQKYGQDSVLHHNGQQGVLIGTNTTGWVGMGKEMPVGQVAYNQPNAPFETEFRPSRPLSARDIARGRVARAPARFTTKDA